MIPFPRKTSFAFPQNSRFIPIEGKLFSATFSFSLGVADPVALNCLITQQTVALLISRDLCNIFWLSSECLHEQYISTFSSSVGV